MKRSNDFTLKCVGGNYLLVPLGTQVMATNALITLNAAGRYIWDLLAEHRTIEGLVVAVTERFDVDNQRARNDVQAFLDEIETMGLIEHE